MRPFIYCLSLSLSPILVCNSASAQQAAPETDPSFVTEQSASVLIQQLLNQNAELKQRIEKLEAASYSPNDVKVLAPSTDLLPKNGLFVQGDVGGQYRQLAGEDGNTATYFDSGFYGSAGIGYRFSKAFRLSVEYTNQSSDAKDVSAFYGDGNPLNGVPLPGLGSIRLNQYTFNAYYDAPGFGYKKRFRPYVGLGVGTQSSTLVGISNTFAAPASLYANGTAWAPIVTFQAGASYIVNKNTEIYAGAKYAQGTELLFRNTDFGNLLPQSSRNWSISGGVRYTF